MNQSIKPIALISYILLIAGIIFKSCHWPGANAILIAGSAAIVLLFILIISTFIGKTPTFLERFNGVFASLTLILSMLAFIFKMMHWPGAGKIIWVADITIILSGILFLIDGLIEKDVYKRNLKFFISFFIVIIVTILFLMEKVSG